MKENTSEPKTDEGVLQELKEKSAALRKRHLKTTKMFNNLTRTIVNFLEQTKHNKTNHR